MPLRSGPVERVPSVRIGPLAHIADDFFTARREVLKMSDMLDPVRRRARRVASSSPSLAVRRREQGEGDRVPAGPIWISEQPALPTS